MDERKQRRDNIFQLFSDALASGVLDPRSFTYTDPASRSAFYRPPKDVIETTGRVVEKDERNQGMPIPPKENAIVPR